MVLYAKKLSYQLRFRFAIFVADSECETAMAKATKSWSNVEVQTFLTILADDRIQMELDVAVRNEHVYRENTEKMAVQGFERTFKQCHEKLKKINSDYRAVRDHNGREAGLDSVTCLNVVEDGEY